MVDGVGSTTLVGISFPVINIKSDITKVEHRVGITPILRPQKQLT